MDLSKYGVESNNIYLKKALTHSSYANEHHLESYERLEFLGDAVLELVISEYLYKKTDLPEGKMSKKRAMYVCEEALDAYAEDIKLNDYILVSSGLMSGVTPSITADVFEAVVATIFLNSGLNKAKEFIYDTIIPKIEAGNVYLSDYKSYLQEYVQTTKQSIYYKIVKEEGPSHDKTFEIEVHIDGKNFGKGVGKSKKEAEQNAAKDAIKKCSGVII